MDVMDAIDTPLLGEGTRDGSVIMPALQKLLQLACSEDTDKQVEVRCCFYWHDSARVIMETNMFTSVS